MRGQIVERGKGCGIGWLGRLESQSTFRSAGMDERKKGCEVLVEDSYVWAGDVLFMLLGRREGSDRCCAGF
jgi:hypothetical protein